jgi:hypothetical protein
MKNILLFIVLFFGYIYANYNALVHMKNTRNIMKMTVSTKDSDKKVTEVNYYTYDRSGWLIERVKFKRNKTNYVLHFQYTNGMLSSKTEIKNKRTNISFFNVSNNLLYEKFYNKDFVYKYHIYDLKSFNLMKTFDGGGGCLDIYTYDKYGNIVLRKNTGDDGEAVKVYENRLNRHHRVVQSYTYDSSGSKDDCRFYSRYTYYKDGKIKELMLIKKGKRNPYFYRKYYYEYTYY